MRVSSLLKSPVPTGRRRLLVLAAATLLMAVSTEAMAGQPRSTDGSAHPGVVTERRVPTDLGTPVVASLVTPPHPVMGSDHDVHLAYELLVLNTAPVPVLVRRIDTVDAARPRTVLTTMQGARLASHMASLSGGLGVRIGPGQTGFVVMDLPLAPSDSVPDRLAHRLTVQVAPSGPTVGPLTTARTPVIHDHAIVVSPALRGARWVDLNGCCAEATAHRGALLAVDGALHLAQRFAIDFVQLQPDHRLVTGPLDMLSSYPFYGAPVVAAAGGVVVRARDGLPNQVPFEPPKGITVATAPGNHVVVALGNGRYAMYAHLAPGSLRVSVGDRVSVGQVLGRLGNSGNSDLPHLHFQVMDSASPLGSEGLPYVFRGFTSPGSVPPIDQIDPTQSIPVSSRLRGSFSQVLPLDRQVMTFPHH